MLKFSSILIITYGRSGSTLLQGVLNSISGCLIRGENNNFCFDLFNSWKSILKAKEKYAPFVENPWYGSHLLNDSLFLSNCKNLIYTLITADKAHSLDAICYGFKEIRYTTTNMDSQTFEEYLQFLSRIFPNPAFVFNTRKITDVAKSEWWKKQPEQEVFNLIESTESNFSKYQLRYPEKCFAITYEDIVEKSVNLKSLYDFLGADYKEYIIDEVLSKPHSYKSIK